MPSEATVTERSPWQIFVLFLKLGLTSFGGPAAHLGFFHHEFVRRRRWLDDAAYSEVVALCQLLPGPASSQVGLAIGYLNGHYRGALAAWLGFTLPSAVLMALVAFGLSHWPGGSGGEVGSGWISGLKLFVVAVVAQAVWQMGQSLCSDRSRLTIAIMVAVGVLVVGSLWTQLLALLMAGVAGMFWHLSAVTGDSTLALPSRGRRPLLFALLFAVLLVLSLSPEEPGSLAWLAAELYRAGALVFGGGHVVLPWLQEGFVASGAVPADTFLAGYGVAQAVPGPLFTFSAFLGGLEAGVAGAVVAVLAVFLPGTLLVFAGLPLWSWLRRHDRARSALAGVNAGVVGLLAAALYDPVWTSAVHSAQGVAMVLLAWLALTVWKLPVWLLAIASAVVGAVLL